jgi:uncharacterized protein (TIGR00661 family)
MKVLYAIQGTGNGHLSRAQEMVPLLKNLVQLDTLVSGQQVQLKPKFELDYQRTGLSFRCGKNGKISIFQTLKATHPIDFIRELKQFPIQQYDLVISDFEPVSAWAAFLHGVPCIELSHQAAVVHPLAPRPEKKDRIGSYILNHYLPTAYKLGFHFEAFAETIYTPVIRKEIRQLNPVNKGHYTVYLPAYHEERLLHFLRQFDVHWEVFSTHALYPYRIDNVSIHPISHDTFQESLRTCSGVLAGAGFELPAEALYLGKKLLVIPMVGQYEQACNGVAAAKVGALCLDQLDLRYFRQIQSWLNYGVAPQVQYEDQTLMILEQMLSTVERVGKSAYITPYDDSNLSLLRYFF